MNSPIPFEEKLDKLRRMHMRSAPDALNQIDQWAEKFARLKAQKEWLEHPMTGELRSIARDQVKLINSALSTREIMTESDRTKLFANKDAHLTYLALLDMSPDSEMASIEASLDNELQP